MQPQTNPSYRVQGDPNAVDSFAACMSAVAAHFGRRSDYAYIAGLTGTCFSPCHNHGEKCVGWKLDGGSAARVDFIAEALGLSLETIALDENDPQAYFARLQQAIQHDRAVVLATWPAWSILSGWDDDPAQLPFLTTPGFEKIVGQIWPPAKTRLAFAFSPTAQAVDPAQVLRDALRYGAQIAAGSITPGLENFGTDNFFGGEMYAEIVDLAGQEFLCAGCSENGCFSRAVRRISDGHQASLRFLADAQSLLGLADGALDSLRQGYQDMAAISGRYVEMAKTPQVFDQPDLRPEIRADFTRLGQLHRQVAQQFQNLLSA